MSQYTGPCARPVLARGLRLTVGVALGVAFAACGGQPEVAVTDSTPVTPRDVALLGPDSAVQPQLALVQAGYRNRYGHPAEPVMVRYAQRGIPVWTSPTCGAAGWSSSAPQQVRCEREQVRRYWHHRSP